MPLVIIAGLPSTGKSFRAKQIRDFMLSENKTNVHIVSENQIIQNKELPKNNIFNGKVFFFFFFNLMIKFDNGNI